MSERTLYEGLVYRNFKWRKTRVHVLEVNMRQRSIRAVPAGDSFPLASIVRPPQLARQAGALASVGAGFPITVAHKLGVTRQPMGTLVIDRELWTTGLGHGGHALLMRPGYASIQPSNVKVHLWHGATTAIPVDHVNRGNDGICMFTYRGGTNELPIAGRQHVFLGAPSAYQHRDGKWVRTWRVFDESVWTGLPILPEVIVIETDASLYLAEGDEVTMTQDFGMPRTQQIITGTSELIRDGKNVVPLLNLTGQESGGPDAWYIRKNPRTAIGVSQDHRTVYLVAAEGRVHGSVGFRLKELATCMIKEVGAWSGTNLDGGGSTHMWALGEGLLADSCYGDGTIDGTRPNIYATAVF